MYRRSTPSHDDYEEGDTIRVKTSTLELLVEVETKEDDITTDPDRHQPGWTGTVVEVIDAMYPSSNGNTPGTEMWGYTNQVKEVK